MVLHATQYTVTVLNGPHFRWIRKGLMSGHNFQGQGTSAVEKASANLVITITDIITGKPNKTTQSKSVTGVLGQVQLLHSRGFFTGEGFL